MRIEISRETRCGACGCMMGENDRFCPECGQQNREVFPDTAAPAGAAPGSAVKRRRLPKFAVFGIVGGAAITVGTVITVVIVVLITVMLAGRHDLSGTYTYYGMFPITSVSFSTDGTFTARCDYYEYSTGAVYHGKYSKHGDTYELRFTGADTAGGNAVTGFTDREFGHSYEMSARKRGDNALDIWVSGGSSYYAWMNTTATFYK